MFKKLFPIVVAISLMIGAAGVTVGVAFASGGTNYPVNAVTSSTDHFGFEGFSSSSPSFSEDVIVSKFAPSQVRGLNGVKFIKPILSLEQAAENNTSDKVPGLSMVYFDVTPRISDIAENIMDKEMATNTSTNTISTRDVDTGLTIYYLAPGATGWVPLSTTMAQGTNGSIARALVPGDGWYALGIDK